MPSLLTLKMLFLLVFFSLYKQITISTGDIVTGQILAKKAGL